MKKVLVLLHVPYDGEGSVGDYLRDRGMAFDVVKVWEPYTLPDVFQYAALIVMGGPMGVYEDFPSRDDELALIKSAAGTVPILAICLGSQLLASALGARVYPNVREGKHLKEVGYYTVELTAEGAASPLFKGFDRDVRVFQWHGDAFDVPAGASLLATAPGCHHQAFAWKNALGVLFHFDLTPEIIHGLVEAHRDWTHQHFDLDEAKLERDAPEYGPLMKAQCYRLLDNFFSATAGWSSQSFSLSFFGR